MVLQACALCDSFFFKSQNKGGFWPQILARLDFRAKCSSSSSLSLGRGGEDATKRIMWAPLQQKADGVGLAKDESCEGACAPYDAVCPLCGVATSHDPSPRLIGAMWLAAPWIVPCRSSPGRARLGKDMRTS